MLVLYLSIRLASLILQIYQQIHCSSHYSLLLVQRKQDNKTRSFPRIVRILYEVQGLHRKVVDRMKA
jgi:hypothetical protein